MSNLVPISATQLPAHLQRGKDKARAIASELAAGVTAGFPIISYRGKVWRIRKGGEETDFVDADGDPIQSINLVLVKSNKNPSKVFYKGKYSEGDTGAPDCWSSDGIKPDADVTDPQFSNCAACPRNKWGSRITEAGKKGRECSDVRRMAVVFLDELSRKGADSHLFLMRVPPASLNPLKDYAEKVLGPAGVEYFAVGTRVGFDSQAAHPKLTFRVATAGQQPRFLTEEEYEAVCELRDSEDVHRILNESEGGGAGTTSKSESEPVATPAARPEPEQETGDDDEDAPAPAPAKSKKKAKPKPAEAEDVEVETPKKKAKSAPPPPDDDEDGDDDDTPPAAAPAAGDAFDNVLSKLLGE